MSDTQNTPSADPFAGVVTAKDIYDTVNDTKVLVQRSLDRQEALEKQHKEFRTELDDMKERVAKNEKWRYMLPISAVGAVGATVVGLAPYIGG